MLRRIKHLVNSSNKSLTAQILNSSKQPQVFVPASKTTPPQIYPDLSISRLLNACKSKEELSSNLLFRSNTILEISDPLDQRVKLAALQTEVFVALQDSLTSGDSRIYQIFSGFSRQVLRSTSPSLRDRHTKFLTNVLLQPCLRLSRARLDLQLNPNRVLGAMGAANFLRFRGALLLDSRLLSEKSVALVFDRILYGNGGKMPLDLVRFAFDLVPAPDTLDDVLGETWNFRRILDSVCQRQSAELLGFFFSRCATAGFRKEAFEFLTERDEITGLPIRPWALEVVRTGALGTLANTFPVERLPMASSENTVGGAQAFGMDNRGYFEPSGSSLTDDAVYYVDSAAKVAGMFRRIAECKELAMSWFPGDRDGQPGVFVFSTKDEAFVVDVLASRISRDFGFFRL